MKYDPAIHHRRSIRLKGYDYSWPGDYFITICVQNREHLFGEIETGRMITNVNGDIVSSIWFDLVNHYGNIVLDEFVVMPNHFHGIIMITGHDGNDADGGGGVGAIHESPNANEPPNVVGAIHVGAIHELPLQQTPQKLRSATCCYPKSWDVLKWFHQNRSIYYVKQQERLYGNAIIGNTLSVTRMNSHESGITSKTTLSCGNRTN